MIKRTRTGFFYHARLLGVKRSNVCSWLFSLGHLYRDRGNTWLEWINGKMTERWAKWVGGTGFILCATILILLNDNMNIRTGKFGVLPVSYTCACVYVVFLFILCSHFQEIEGWKKVQRISFLSYIGRNSVIYVCTNHAALRAAKKFLVCCGLAEGQAKASFWFLVCSFFQKGISLVTTPIFTRLLSTAEYGQYNVFNSWLGIITIFVTLNLFYGIYTEKSGKSMLRKHPV